jgi:thiazole synthase ThiGH ThiG subunit
MRLELDRVGAGFRGGIDKLRRQSDVAVVVDAGLGDDKARTARADFAGSNREVRTSGHEILAFAGMFS